MARLGTRLRARAAAVLHASQAVGTVQLLFWLWDCGFLSCWLLARGHSWVLVCSGRNAAALPPDRSQYNGLTTTREINNRIKQVTKMPNQMPKRLTRFQWPILRYQVPFLIISSCVSILRGDYITCFWLDFFSQLEKLSEQPIISYIKNFTSSVIFIPIQTTYC